MADIVPATRPRMSYGELMARLKPLGLTPDTDPLFVVGVRGYYRDTMGEPGRNDIGIYDDAIFLVSPLFLGSYNGNTDPSRRQPGYGRAEDTRGMATLKTGLWRVHRFDLHKDIYLALCQRAGKVTVTRDGVVEDYEDYGRFGINIHKGGWATTSSLGCQTIHPSQWDAFIEAAVDQAKRHFGEAWKTTTIPYALIDA